MLQNIEITNFQSLHKINVELGNFTVIIGPSSSGKSAFLRAIKTLVNNARGTSYVTHGAKHASITAKGQYWSVALERGEGVGSYKTVVGDENHLYTKLSGNVPEPVSKILRINPLNSGGDIHFAGQFDKPYLLDESGQSVARSLGELTNVSTILEAVREANRKRSAFSSELKVKEEKLKDLSSKVREFDNLNAELAKVAELEAALPEVKELDSRIQRLSSLVIAINQAISTVHSFKEIEIPDFEPVMTLEARYKTLKTYVESINTIVTLITTLNANIVQHAEELAAAESKLSELLVAHGECPVCGRIM